LTEYGLRRPSWSQTQQTSSAFVVAVLERELRLCVTHGPKEQWVLTGGFAQQFSVTGTPAARKSARQSDGAFAVNFCPLSQRALLGKR
jgi:hypothetical protein